MIIALTCNQRTAFVVSACASQAVVAHFEVLPAERAAQSPTRRFEAFRRERERVRAVDKLVDRFAALHHFLCNTQSAASKQYVTTIVSQQAVPMFKAMTSFTSCNTEHRAWFDTVNSRQGRLPHIQAFLQVANFLHLRIGRILRLIVRICSPANQQIARVLRAIGSGWSAQSKRGV